MVGGTTLTTQAIHRGLDASECYLGGLLVMGAIVHRSTCDRLVITTLYI